MVPETNNGSADVRHGWLISLGALLKPITAAVVASLTSIVAYVATPLNEYVNSLFWDEKAEILLISQNSNLKQGDVSNLNIIIQPQAPIAISEGTLEIKYTTANLRPGAESIEWLVTPTPRITASKQVFNRALDFIADAPGNAEISATLKTKAGATFSKILPVEILSSANQAFPTRRNFSGKWNIDLGGIHGQMEIKDVARTLSGEYKLSDGNYGQIEGSRDGKTFRVTFYRGMAPSRFFVEAAFDPNPKVDLELQGHAKLLIPTSDKNNPWKEERQVAFNGVALAQ